METPAPGPPTDFAPAERASEPEVQDLVQRVSADPVLRAMLESVPGFAMLLNRERQIIAANARLCAAVGAPLDQFQGFRPGEVVGCVHATDKPGGCGTSEACSVCGAANALVECTRLEQTVTRECQLQLASDPAAALELEAVATPIRCHGADLTVLFMRDISGEKRRRVLERFFFHDVLNTAGACEGLSRMLAEGECVDPSERSELEHLLASGIRQLTEEILGQHQLMAAESGELEVEYQEVSLAETLEEVAALCRHLGSSHEREIVVETLPDVTLVTDSRLLRRVLINLIKNALEGTPAGQTVRVRGELLGDRALVEVQNPALMPREVRLQVFKRSFSTKGAGRGVGTYSIKLLAEGYLGGRVSFTSTDSEGTVFRVELPADARGTAAPPRPPRGINRNL